MPKISRSKSKKVENPVRLRKFAVSEKEVLEKIVTDNGEIKTVPNKSQEVAKKDQKKKARHEAWLEKLDHAYNVKKKLQKKENKKKNGLKTDLSSIHDILNDIEIKPKSELESKATHAKKLEQPIKQAAIPSNKIRSKKAKKQAEMQEILRMQKVMQHSAFKQNPLATIRQHIENTFNT
ncbi:ribosome biogenesis protein SLX9-domain-containing protein [Cokeromyces recurvatus]|uniref:ribosome biogenesis protein SLX9-domain-containing protein n=1 Tax=Cokeromyces recurvatus TaxID=90255 RepID=UPI00221FFEFE|nr:ribosome biogenesis protein SLX9-domain-containing protein [Cokeromyces recurvatus]KAI7904702.1 ribosome biogenesis protein SLX9-domain-containing protein [Cokeromyces recurvatus]